MGNRSTTASDRVDASLRHIANGGSLLLSGSQGAGKSWNLTRVLDALEASGAGVVHRYSGSQTARSIPFGAFAPLLAASDQMDAAKSQLIAAVSSALVEDDDRAVFLGIDDADLLDDASATVVTQLARAGEVVVVATQSEGAVTPWIDSLSRLGLLSAVSIEPLNRHEVVALAEHHLGTPIDASLASALHLVGLGNPARVRSVLDGSRLDNRIVESGGLWKLATSGTDLVATAEFNAGFDAALDSLEPKELEVLELVATVEHAPFDLVECLSGARSIESLERAGLLLVEVDRSRSVSTVADPLFANHVRTRIPFTTRRRIATAVGAWHDKVGMRRTGDALCCARASLQAVAPMTTTTSVQAAREALRLHQPVIAEKICELALRRSSSFEPQLLLGQALLDQAKTAEAALRADAARTAARSAAEQVDVAILRSAINSVGRQRPDEAYASLEVGYRAASTSEDRARLDLAHAQIDLSEGHSGRAYDVLTALPDTVVSALQAHDRAEVRFGVATAAHRGGRYEQALELVERQLEELRAARRPDRALEDRLARLQIAVLLALGRIERATDLLAEAGVSRSDASTSTSTSTLRSLIAWTLLESDASLLAGDVAGAIDAAEDAVRLVRSARPDLHNRSHAQAALVKCHAGDLTGARQHIAQLDEPFHADIETRVVAARAHAWSYALDGERAEATELLLKLQEQTQQVSEFHFAAMLAHDAIRLDGSAEVDDMFDQLVSRMDPGLAQICASFAHGRGTRDVVALDDAARRFHRAGALQFAAEAARCLAEVCEADGDQNSSRRAHARADALLHSCPGASVGIAVRADSLLTSRQQEVASLAWRHSNIEIAERLCISVRTVENHLNTVFHLLGIHSRSELTSVFAPPAHDLVAS